MHDNARSHVAGVVTDYLHEAELTVMEWLPLSPDLNLIEYVWDELGKLARSRIPLSGNLEEPKTALVEDWNNIPQETIQKIITGMNTRMQAVITARGRNTSY